MVRATTTNERTHYETLRVSSKASPREVRTAFRQLVKVYHPDKNPQRTEWAEVRMRQLLEAYQVISDRQRRNVYDRRLQMQRAGVSFAERMARKPKDFGAQSQLLLYHLLQGHFDEAIALHETLKGRRIAFSLADHLDDCDYLDSLFLLGEAYEARKQWRTATRFYWEAYEQEAGGPKKRYFFDELRDRLRVLFSQRLVQGLSPEDTLKNYRRALDLCVTNRDAALIHKKIAAIQTRLGHDAEAMGALDKAERLCPGMKAIGTMRKRIAGA